MIAAGLAGLHGDETDVGVHAVGDEHLRAVQHPLVADATRRGAHRLEVGPRIGFGHRDGGDLPAGDEVGHQRAFCRRARVVQVRRSPCRCARAP
jgi:hypothetical protein